MALNANALTTLARAKGYLDIPVANIQRDDEVEDLVNAASDFIERRCDRKFVEQTHIEYQDGRRANRILLRHYPITGGPADGATKPELRLDSESLFVDASTIVGVTEYYPIDEVEIAFVKNRQFPLGTRNIQITYTAGFAVIPSGLERACINLIQWWESLDSNRDLGRPTKSKSGENSSVMQDVPPIIDQLLQPFIRVQFAGFNVGVMNG